MKLYTQVLIVCCIGALLGQAQSGRCVFGCFKSMINCSRKALSTGIHRSACCKPYADCFHECTDKPAPRCKFAKRGSWNKRGDEEDSMEDFGLMDGPYFL